MEENKELFNELIKIDMKISEIQKKYSDTPGLINDFYHLKQKISDYYAVAIKGIINGEVKQEIFNKEIYGYTYNIKDAVLHFKQFRLYIENMDVDNIYTDDEKDEILSKINQNIEGPYYFLNLLKTQYELNKVKFYEIIDFCKVDKKSSKELDELFIIFNEMELVLRKAHRIYNAIEGIKIDDKPELIVWKKGQKSLYKLLYILEDKKYITGFQNKCKKGNSFKHKIVDNSFDVEYTQGDKKNSGLYMSSDALGKTKINRQEFLDYIDYMERDYRTEAFLELLSTDSQNKTSVKNEVPFFDKINKNKESEEITIDNAFLLREILYRFKANIYEEEKNFELKDLLKQYEEKEIAILHLKEDKIITDCYKKSFKSIIRDKEITNLEKSDEVKDFIYSLIIEEFF